MNNKQKPAPYSYKVCYNAIESLNNDIDAVKRELYSLLAQGKECFDYGYECEDDALNYFKFVLEYTTYYQEELVCVKEEFADVAKEAFEYLCSLSGCESDSVWEYSAMQRAKYKHLFE